MSLPACVHCGKPLRYALICLECQTVQERSAQADFFAVFGLPMAPGVDVAALDQAYEKLAMALHPDFFAASPAPLKATVLRLSARLNEGYQVLKNPSSRSAYLLDRLWAQLDTAQSLPLQPDRKRLPDGFLEQMLEYQDEAEETQGDAGRQGALRETLAEELGQLLAERAKLFHQAMERADAALLQALQTNLNCENYYQRLLEGL